ncbi:hypothetical protein [Candidatus Magnetaquicoccus inordinatus]|uniref:hypothetical protein n=1 Tax=Candidatus Magnetaquicoccus inordinatus TaxID=2496818 RepID=UPI00102AEEC9|nr:hypothetical protein [Candidatus Magnetaquicoccus inordinatus]
MAIVTRNLNATLLHASKTFIDVPWPPFTEFRETLGRADAIAEYLRARRIEMEIQRDASRSFDDDGRAFAMYEALIRQIDEFLPIHRGACEFFFRESLVKRRYIGLGYKMGEFERSLIPPSEWGFLDFDYEKNSAYSTEHGIAYAGLEFIDMALLDDDEKQKIFRRGSATNEQTPKPKRDKVATQAWYQKWYAEYKSIKEFDSSLSDATVYKKIKTNLNLTQSVETIARKIRELKQNGE